MSSRPPCVGIVCDVNRSGRHPLHAVQNKYIEAVRDGVGAVPFLIPALDRPLDPRDVLSRVDGLFFSGAYSNVAPRHYGGPGPRDGVLQDENRDAMALPLLTAAIAAGIPVLGVCRGFQELNVALGGTLHQHLHEVPGRRDHREPGDAPLETQYGPAHAVRIAPGGILAPLMPGETVMVNSLHGQGIDRLAPGLFAEAMSEDGVVEAVSMPDAKGFVLAVQWHPEWQWQSNPVSRALFSAFAKALEA